MHWLWVFVIGLVIGLVAKLLMPGKDRAASSSPPSSASPARCWRLGPARTCSAGIRKDNPPASSPR